MDKKPTFIDLRCDFGFKHCMGDAVVMKSFLNATISEEYGRIESLTFANVESKKGKRENRGVIFDLRCKVEDGSEILVEMQNYAHPYFKTRANYYLYRLMDEYISQGTNWSKMKEDIPHLIGIFILGKNMMGLDKTVTKTAECDLSNKKVFWDRMQKYFISLPHVQRLTKKASFKEIWFNIIKNLGSMRKIDESILEKADEGLLRLINKAKVAALSKEEYAEYEASLKALADEGAAEVYGYNRGLAEGSKKQAIKSASALLKKGIDKEIVKEAFPNLSEAEFEQLEKEINA